MNPWSELIKQQEAIDFNSASFLSEGFVAPLADVGLIACTGEDAASFLHGQLTNDVVHLQDNEARLAGYCSPKGRLLATFLVWKTGDTIFLQLPREILPAIQKRLQMFVLRAKVKLTDVSDAHIALGTASNRSSSNAATTLSPYLGTLPLSPYAKTDSHVGSLIRVVDTTNYERYLWITSPEIALQVWPKITATLPPTNAAAWRLSEIEAGIPHITQATQEQFVPQMINFELIGGVNFKKGCYPGQEVVARSQYLGKLKRRMMLATVDTTHIQAGTEVFSTTDPHQPCGRVVNAERASEATYACLVELKLDAINAGTVCQGSADGPPFQFKEPPYALQDPE